MNIDSIKNGIVLDHIRAGRGMQIYNSLGLDQLDCSVAIIKNVKSSKMGKKDIIKISDAFEVNFDVLGYIDPEVTVCVIENGSVKSKHKVELPEKIVNIAKCKNPRCITSVEQGLDHVFYLANKDKRIYRCLYCETKVEKKQKLCFYFYAGVAPTVEQLTRNQQAVGSNPISSTIIKINSR